MSFINYFFLLNFKRIHRIVQDGGIHYAFVYFFVLSIFSLVSFQVLTNINHGEYIYASIGLYFTFLFRPSSELIRNVCSHRQRMIVTILTSLVVLTFFEIGLVVAHEFMIALLLLPFGVMISFVHQTKEVSFVIPTPFYNHPFEFIAGFRQSLLAIVCLFILAGIGVYVGNFNLALAGLILLLLMLNNFYINVEPSYFIWNYLGAKQLLLSKVSIGLFYSFLLSIPILVLLLIRFSENYMPIMLVEMIGLLLVCMSMVMKYAFSSQYSATVRSIILIFCMLMPPLLLVLLPWMTQKALTQLKTMI